MHVYPSVLSPRVQKHVSRASQQLARGLSSSAVPMTGRIFFLFLSFFLYYSLLEWGNVFLLRALCCYVYGLCYRDHATVALERCCSHVILSQEGLQSTHTAGRLSSGWEFGCQAEMCSCKSLFRMPSTAIGIRVFSGLVGGSPELVFSLPGHLGCWLWGWAIVPYG